MCVSLNLQVEMAMRASMSILQGSFDPIMDANNNTDLLPLIIQAKVGHYRLSLSQLRSYISDK